MVQPSDLIHRTATVYRGSSFARPLSLLSPVSGRHAGQYLSVSADDGLLGAAVVTCRDVSGRRASISVPGSGVIPMHPGGETPPRLADRF